MKSEGLSLIFFKDITKDGWDKITNDFDITINYTSWFLNYIEVLNDGTKIQNFTFLIYKNDNPIAIVPLYIESIDNAWQISMGQEPVFSPIFCKNFKIKEKSETLAFILENVNHLAKKYNCIL
ncbi:hypothetical protein OAO97_01025, partial [Candidatus Pseudothioglobus singularis]|nr:hypothetical protein [Candidatus Pseudothioglobus singularis]